MQAFKESWEKLSLANKYSLTSALLFLLALGILLIAGYWFVSALMILFIGFVFASMANDENKKAEGDEEVEP